MTQLNEIEEFFNNINHKRSFTGEVSETFLDGEVEIRVSVYETDDNHRAGSFSILMKTEKDIEELAQEKVYRAADVKPEFQQIEEQFMELIDENCGYNPYEILLDEADRKQESEFDIVAYDSFIVFD